MPDEPAYYCYLLISSQIGSQRTYIGATTDVDRRLRQHNGEITGGAKATRMNRPWCMVCFVSGFKTWSDALSFEYFWKRKHRRICRGLPSRIARCRQLLDTTFWSDKRKRLGRHDADERLELNWMPFEHLSMSYGK